MKRLSRIGAIVLAAAMVLTLCTTAGADVNSNGTRNAYNGIESSENTLNIAKQIVFINAEATTVREPNIVYTYTIAAAAPGDNATITGLDSENYELIVPVKAGPIGAVTGSASATTSTVTFADTNTAPATATGTADTKYAAFTFTPATFGAPGVYRYVITESTTSGAKAAVGVTQSSSYNDTRYLDVYVKWNDGRTALEIYGYVLFEGTATKPIAYNQSTDLAAKSQGFVNTAESGEHPADVDSYTTQNLLISKTTTGALADTAHDFPVSITFTKASGLTTGIKLDYAVTGSGTLTKTGTDDTGDYVTMDAALSGTVRNASTITITGVPNGSSVVMTETNDTVDYYRVKAGTAAGDADLLTEAVITPNGSTDATDSVTLTDAKGSIYLTNTLDTISPTGYVSRFAPYALLLAGGILLLIIARKHKKHAEEED